MEKDKFVICRPFYCPLCEAKPYSNKEYFFVVFGGESQTFFIRKTKQQSKKGITPSIIMYDGIKDDTHTQLLVACSVVGCGVEIYHTDSPEYPYDITFKKVRLYKLLHADVKALLEYKDETYKLD